MIEMNNNYLNQSNVFFSIVTYNESTKPVIQLYEKDDLVQRIDASSDADKVLLINCLFCLIVNLRDFRFLEMFNK